jgi:hypothetical protein
MKGMYLVAEEAKIFLSLPVIQNHTNFALEVQFILMVPFQLRNRFLHE